LYSENSATLSGDVHEGVSIKAEVSDVDIKVGEMSVVKVEEGTVMDIKEEESSVLKFEEEVLVDTKEEDFPCTLKAEQDQVSYMYVCPLLDTFYEYPIMCTIFCHVILSGYLSVCLSPQKTAVSVRVLCATVLRGLGLRKCKDL
jgi:hypothetical protein